MMFRFREVMLKLEFFFVLTEFSFVLLITPRVFTCYGIQEI